MVSINDYMDDPKYKIVGVSINETDHEIECYVTELNAPQKSIPQVINGYNVVFLKTYI